MISISIKIMVIIIFAIIMQPWGEPRESGGKPHRSGENVQTPHRKTLLSYPGVEAAVLTTTTNELQVKLHGNLLSR